MKLIFVELQGICVPSVLVRSFEIGKHLLHSRLGGILGDACSNTEIKDGSPISMASSTKTSGIQSGTSY